MSAGDEFRAQAKEQRVKYVLKLSDALCGYIRCTGGDRGFVHTHDLSNALRWDTIPGLLIFVARHQAEFEDRSRYEIVRIHPGDWVEGGVVM